MKQTTLIIIALVAFIFVREIKHAQRITGANQYYNDLMSCELALDQLQDRYYADIEKAREQGHNEILERF